MRSNLYVSTTEECGVKGCGREMVTCGLSSRIEAQTTTRTWLPSGQRENALELLSTVINGALHVSRLHLSYLLDPRVTRSPFSILLRLKM